MHRFTLTVLAALALLVAAAYLQADVTYLVQDDAYVKSDGTGSGAGAYLAIKRDEVAVSSNHRKAYINFGSDLGDAVTARSGRKLAARLDLPMVDSGAGTTGSSTPWDFEVYGLTDESLEGWDESTIDWNNAPANDTADGNTVVAADTTSVGTFSGAGKMAGATQMISGAPLLNYLDADTTGDATFIVLRNTQGAAGNTYVHAIESKEASGTNTGASLSLLETDNRIGAAGEFETAAGDFTTNGWSNPGSVAKEHAGLIAGSQKAARIDSSVNNTLINSPDAVSERFVVDYYFATADGGGSGNRGLAVNYRFNGNGQINLRVNGDGNIQLYNDQALGGSTGWKHIGDLASIVQFSEDNAGDTGFDDVGDTLNVHRLKLVMHGSGTANPTYDIYLSAANVTTFTAVAQGLEYFQYSVPNSSSQTGLDGLHFIGDLADADFVVDSVYIAIPEPASFALLGVGAMGLIRRRGC